MHVPSTLGGRVEELRRLARIKNISFSVNFSLQTIRCCWLSRWTASLSSKSVRKVCEISRRGCPWKNKDNVDWKRRAWVQSGHWNKWYDHGGFQLVQLFERLFQREWWFARAVHELNLFGAMRTGMWGWIGRHRCLKQWWCQQWNGGMYVRCHGKEVPTDYLRSGKDKLRGEVQNWCDKKYECWSGLKLFEMVLRSDWLKRCTVLGEAVKGIGAGSAKSGWTQLKMRATRGHWYWKIHKDRERTKGVVRTTVWMHKL